MTTTIVPAAPGWNVMCPVTDNDQVVEFYRELVVAWRVDLVEYRAPRDGQYFTTVDPVTAEGFGPTDPLILERPDGRIVFHSEADFESEDEALVYLNREEAGR